MHTSIFDNKKRYDDKPKRWIPYKCKSLDSVVPFDDPKRGNPIISSITTSG